MAKPVPLELYGIANISRRPDRGVVSIEISHKGEIQADVSKQVQETALAIQTQIRPLAERDSSMGESELPPVPRWSSDAMISRYTTETFWVDQYGNIVSDPRYMTRLRSDVVATGNMGVIKKTTKTYYASINMVVRFRDFVKLSEFTAGLASLPLVQVTQVVWVLTEETKKELRGQAIKEAYIDAYEKASAFAEAMGGRTVCPVNIKSRGTELTFARSAAGRGGGLDNAMPGMAMQVQQMQRPLGQQIAAGETALTYVPQDVSFSSEWDIKFELE